MLSLKVFAFSFAAALIALASFSVILPPQDDFNPSNPYWNGLTEFSRVANASIMDAAVFKPDPKSTVIFVIGPSVNITGERVEAWRKYVEDGGVLVIMDETGIVNRALEALGLNVKVEGHMMLDAVFYYNSWRIPKIMDFRGALARNISEVIMDVPSILNLTGGFRILAYSSRFSFLDLDGDGEPSSGEPAGPFPVAAEIQYGGGRIILFSDSSLFINGVIGGNLQLLKNILDGRRAILDSGVWSKTLHSQFRGAVLLAYSFISQPEIKYSLTAAALIALYMLAAGGFKPKVEDEVKTLIAKHPDWDVRLLEMLREARGKIEQQPYE
jgi:hypothetical protein